MKMFEMDMVNACYNYFLSNDANLSDVICEVPFLSRCIDMVLLTKDKQTVTIEFKIKNWRQALVQAKNHKLGADRSYICLPERNPSEELLNILEREEIGLYLFNPSSSCIIHEFVPAPHNKKKIDIFNNMLITTAKNISEKV
jgi:hypothetical protein